MSSEIGGCRHDDHPSDASRLFLHPIRPDRAGRGRTQDGTTVPVGCAMTTTWMNDKVEQMATAAETYVRFHDNPESTITEIQMAHARFLMAARAIMEWMTR